MPALSLNGLLDDRRETGVYRIRCTVDGKQYVGSAAKSFKSRRADHWKRLRSGKHFSRHLQHAWNKFGEHAFVFEIVERCAPEHAIAQEQVFIDYWKATDRKHGYNTSPTAGNCLGLKHDETFCEKISSRNRGKTLSVEHRQKIALAHLGKKLSAESKAKMSVAKRGTKHTTQSRENMAASKRGKKFTLEHRAKIGDANRRRTISEQMRLKIGAANRRRIWTDESRAKLSKSLLARKFRNEKTVL